MTKVVHVEKDHIRWIDSYDLIYIWDENGKIIKQETVNFKRRLK